MSDCNACEGNVSHNKTCYLCGRKGPLGQGWQMYARDLETEVVQLRAQLAAPLRLGRGPTLEEVRAHMSAGGRWLLRRANPWYEYTLTEVVEPGLYDGDDVVGNGGFYFSLSSCSDAIPLNASRQPCRVGG